MSRSYKLPIIKDGLRNGKKSTHYWRPLRRIVKNLLHIHKDDDMIPPAKSIINDYDYQDWISRCTDKNCYCLKQYNRKKCTQK